MAAIATSIFSQHLLSQSNHPTYFIRGVTRMNTVPDDRQADYAFRDIYMTLMTGFLNEWMMRNAESMYTAPHYVESLGFHNLTGEYQGVAGAKNYKRLPQILEHRMLGHLVSDKNFDKIPKLLREYDNRKATPAQKEEYEVLAEQLQRRFDTSNYLQQNYGLSEEKAEALKKVIDDVDKNHIEKLFKPGKDGLTPAQTPETKRILGESIKKFEGELKTAFGTWNPSEVLQHVKRPDGKWAKSIEELMHDGLTSRAVQAGIAQTRKNGTWAKMLVSLGFNVIYYGMIANSFDFNVLQPWQKKLAQTRGTTKEVVSPLVWGLPPAFATIFGMFFLTKKIPGYATRFLINWGSGMAVYTTTALLMIKNRLNQAPKGKYAVMAEKGLKLEEQRKAKEAQKAQATDASLATATQPQAPTMRTPDLAELNQMQAMQTQQDLQQLLKQQNPFAVQGLSAN